MKTIIIFWMLFAHCCWAQFLSPSTTVNSRAGLKNTLTTLYPSAGHTSVNNYVIDFNGSSYIVVPTNNMRFLFTTNRMAGRFIPTQVIINPFNLAAGSEPQLWWGVTNTTFWKTNIDARQYDIISNLTLYTFYSWGAYETNVMVDVKQFKP